MRTSLKLIGTLFFLVCNSLAVGAEASPSTSTDSGDDSTVTQEETKSDTSDQELYDAIQGGNAEKVKTIVSTKPRNLNTTLISYSPGPPKGIFGQSIQYNPYTPLGLAVRFGHTEIVQFLLNQPNIDVNAGSLKTKKAPLHLAANAGQLELLIMLLNKPGIKKNKKTYLTSRTPFFLACENGHLDCVMKLHEQGVDINIPNAAGITPLDAAEHRAHPEIVSFLEQHGGERGDSAAIYEQLKQTTTSSEDN